jgi:cytochrome c oxidase cbb3-type subunit 2
VHLGNPRDVVPESNMPSYSWLAATPLAIDDIGQRMQALRRIGVPYTDDEIAKSAEQLKGKTEEDAVIAYLQNLGLALRNAR